MVTALCQTPHPLLNLPHHSPKHALLPTDLVLTASRSSAWLAGTGVILVFLSECLLRCVLQKSKSIIHGLMAVCWPSSGALQFHDPCHLSADLQLSVGLSSQDHSSTSAVKQGLVLPEFTSMRCRVLTFNDCQHPGHCIVDMSTSQYA